MVGLIYKRCVDISTDDFSVSLEPLISSLDPSVKTCKMGDFNINLLDNNLSPPVENVVNLIMSKVNFQPYLKIQCQSTIELFQMRAYQTLKIQYKILTGTQY